MTLPQPRRFEARLELFPELREHAERCCLDTGLERGAIDRLILVLEELFANTVEHGYSGLADPPSGKSVWLAIKTVIGRIEVVYEDAAPEHDPFNKVAEPDYTGPIDSWQVGGVGVSLVIKLGRNVRYERVGDRNRIRFAIPDTPPGA